MGLLLEDLPALQENCTTLPDSDDSIPTAVLVLAGLLAGSVCLVVYLWLNVRRLRAALSESKQANNARQPPTTVT